MAEDKETNQEKTEPASGFKKEDSRKKGNVARSVELNSAAMIVIGIMIISIAGPMLASQIGEVSRSIFTNAGLIHLDQLMAYHYMAKGIGWMLLYVVPILLIFMAVGLTVNIAQVGMVFSFEALEPKMNRFNPLEGLKRLMFSKRAFVELSKNFVKLFIVGYVAYSAVAGVIEEAMPLMDGDVSAVLAMFGTAAFSIVIKAGGAFLILAFFDYAFQRYQHEQELMMTKEEVKEETKTHDGNPAIKGRIKSAQRKLAQRRMMQKVPTADVVITNPTHLAVAVKYDAEKMGAPRVVAKGADLIAKKIREIALAHGVPIVEDKALARALYNSVEVDEEIPEKLFHAVAQMLAYIYRLKKSKRRSA